MSALSDWGANVGGTVVGCLFGLIYCGISLLVTGLLFMTSIWLAFWFLRLIGVMAP